MKRITGFSKYYITEDGIVYSTNNKIKKFQIKRGYYSVRLSENGNTKDYRVHRLVAQIFIPNPENKPVINHINGNRLDNRKENLRICTRSENCRNKKVRSDSKSGYKGVNPNPNGRYQAYIGDPTRKSQHIHLGYHATKEEAARAYDKKAIELHGEFANLNFPKDNAWT